MSWSSSLASASVGVAEDEFAVNLVAEADAALHALGVAQHWPQHRFQAKVGQPWDGAELPKGDGQPDGLVAVYLPQQVAQAASCNSAAFGETA